MKYTSHKIFKVERIDSRLEFKGKTKDTRARRRKNKNAQKRSKNFDLKYMIEAQTKLHNEEKENLMQAEIQTQAEHNKKISCDLDEIELIKSDPFISVEQETKDTSNEEDYHECVDVPHHKIYVTSIDAAILEGLDFIENAPMIRQAQQNFHLQKQNLLPLKPDNSHEYTLVLDLDETLVHWSIAPFEGFDEIQDSIYISYRPYLIDFLRKVSQHFEVVVFTASEKDYATMVLDKIDPGYQYISHRLFRDSCLPLNGNYIKDLSVLGRDVNKTIIIDNSIIAFSLNLDNGIPIHSYWGNKQDDELSRLIQILEYATEVAKGEKQINLREYLISIFRLKERITFCQSQYLAYYKQSIEVKSG